MFGILHRVAHVNSHNIPLPAALSKLYGKVCDYIPDTYNAGSWSYERVMTFAQDNVLSGEPGVGVAQDLGVTPRDVEEASGLYLKMWRRGTAFSENI
jgi:hypothetical protein